MKFLAEDKLQSLLKELANAAQVVIPARAEDAEGMVSFRAWEPGVEPELDVLLTRQSAKEFIFKQCEEYLTYHYTMEGETGVPEEEEEGSPGEDEDGLEEIAHETLRVEARVEAPPQVLFGLRPCDASGLVQIDNVFSGYGGFYFDPMYNARREATTILAVACAEPRSTCFCTSLGGSPSGTEGVDALFTPVEGGFTVEALTDKGEELVKSSAFVDAEGSQEEAAAKVKEEIEGKVDEAFGLEGVRENLQANFEDTEAGTSWPADAYPAVPAPTCVRTATASTSRITRWRQAGRGYVPGTTVSTLLTLWRPQVTIREPASGTVSAIASVTSSGITPRSTTACSAPVVGAALPTARCG